MPVTGEKALECGRVATDRQRETALKLAASWRSAAVAAGRDADDGI